MVSHLLLILSVAVLFYAVLPMASETVYKSMMRKRLEFFRGEGMSSGVYARVSGFSSGKILLEAVSSGGLITVIPLETVFFVCDGGVPRKIPWRLFLSLPRGLGVFYIPPAGFTSPVKMRHPEDRKTPFRVPRLVRRRGVCVFYDASRGVAAAPPSAVENAPLEFSLPRKSENPPKPFFVAAGAFVEFVFFLLFLRDGGDSAAAILSLAAVFGRAAPYCPPGLFCTLGAASLLSRKPDKKPVAFALKTFGVAVNIALFLLVVGSFSA